MDELRGHRNTLVLWTQHLVIFMTREINEAFEREIYP